MVKTTAEITDYGRLPAHPENVAEQTPPQAPEKVAHSPDQLRRAARRMRAASAEIGRLQGEIQRLAELQRLTDRLLELGERGSRDIGYGMVAGGHAFDLNMLANELDPDVSAENYAATAPDQNLEQLRRYANSEEGMLRAGKALAREKAALVEQLARAARSEDALGAAKALAQE